MSFVEEGFIPSQDYSEVEDVPDTGLFILEAIICPEIEVQNAEPLLVLENLSNYIEGMV